MDRKFFPWHAAWRIKQIDAVSDSIYRAVNFSAFKCNHDDKWTLRVSMRAATWRWEAGINKQRLPAFRTNPAKSLCEISKHIKSLNMETYERCDCVKKKKKEKSKKEEEVERKKKTRKIVPNSCFYKLFPVALSRFNGYGSNTRSSFIRVNGRIHNGG